MLVRFDHGSLDIHVAQVVIKALLKRITLYLLSHSRMRIIVLTCLDNTYVMLH